MWDKKWNKNYHVYVFRNFRGCGSFTLEKEKIRREEIKN